MAYIDEIGSRDTLLQSDRAEFQFVDFEDDSRWSIQPNSGRLPWWVLVPKRRVPGSSLRDYLGAARLRGVGPETTVAEFFDTDRQAFRRFWEPLTVAVLNTEASEAAASLLWPVLAETFGQGEAACRPCIARRGLSDTFVKPAIATLARRGAAIKYGSRLRAIDAQAGKAKTLRFAKGDVALAPDDGVALAIPAPVAKTLLPGLVTPRGTRPIANAHYRLDEPAQVPGHLPFLGIIGGVAEWLFVRGNVVSVTVSAAGHVIDTKNDRLAQILWQDVARALQIQNRGVPPCRIVKEKRATFAQTPAEVRRRPGPITPLSQVVLAGDWTNTGLPATIEGSIRSGRQAAKMLTGTPLRLA